MCLEAPRGLFLPSPSAVGVDAQPVGCSTTASADHFSRISVRHNREPLCQSGGADEDVGVPDRLPALLELSVDFGGLDNDVVRQGQDAAAPAEAVEGLDL